MRWLLTGLLLFATGWAYAPTTLYQERWTEITARVTCYSPLQKGEKKVNHRMKSVRNENGVAVPAGTLPDGAEVWIEGVGMRVVDDRIPKRSATKLLRRNPTASIVLDVRYYGTLDRGKPINRQLRKRDKGLVRVFVRG